jgi:HlyD family secretion protein
VTIRVPAKWLWTGAAAIAVLAVLISVNRTADSKPEVSATEDRPLVSVVIPALQSINSTVSFTGALVARYDIPISAEGEGERITKVLVEAGARVKKDQVLALLDRAVLRPRVNSLQATLEEARAQANLSAAEYQRAQGMASAGALSVEEIERRRAAAVTDEARVKVAAAQLTEAQVRLVQTEIKAPAAGVVLTRAAEVGQMATPGQVLFRIAGGGEIEMHGQVAERDIAALSIGQPARVYLTGIATPFTGKVRLLGAIIDPQTRQGEIRIALQQSPALRPGAFARGEVLLAEQRRPLLPQSAVLSDARGAYVLIVTAQNKVQRRTVEIANATDRGIVIQAGLNGTEKVVATAAAFLREGEMVTIAAAGT